jgi:hypothetical protein
VDGRDDTCTPLPSPPPPFRSPPQDTRFDDPRDIPLMRGPDSRNPIRSLRARAVLIDMEEGVVNQVRTLLHHTREHIAQLRA